MGANLVKKTVDLIISGEAEAIEQERFINSETELKSAPKIFKETCEIDLNKSVEEAYNFVRGMSPYPCAWLNIRFPNQAESMIWKIFETEKEFEKHDLAIGTVVSDGKKQAKIALKDGFLILKSVQAPAKKRMEIGELLRGMK